MEEKERYRYIVATNKLYDSQEDELYFYNINSNKVISILNQQDKRIKELVEENQQLKQEQKQQVREEVVDEIRERLKKANFEIMSPIDLYSYTDNFLYQVKKGKDPHIAKLQKKELKEKDQDKISFAIEQLEKLKIELHFIHTDLYLKLIDKEIDNQIKSLKGEE